MNKSVYTFGGGAVSDDPRAKDKTIVGGKGANLAEMAGIGLPVPPGFTITTDACRAYLDEGWPDGLDDEVDVIALQCGVVLLAEQHPFAAERISGRQRVPQPIVIDVLAQESLGQLLDDSHSRMIRRQCGVVVLQLPQPPPLRNRRPRQPAVSGQLLRAVRPVLLRHHPRRRALEDSQFAHDIGEFGDDPERFTDAKSRRNYAGTSPITIASGKKRAVLARHARNKRLYDAIDQWAFCSLQPSPGARAYYDQRRAAGDTHHRALRALSNRWVGILHGCLTHRTPYDEHTAWAHRQPVAA